VERRDGATVVDLLFDGGSGADVKAYLVVPAVPGPHAGVLWVHWLGEPETTNRTQFLAEAVALAPKGFVSLLVDAMWSKPKWYAERVPEEDFDNSRRQVVALRRAMDVLQSQSGVDKARLGIVGHDYGGMYAMLMAGADPRAKTYVYVATAPSLSHWAFFANQPKSKVEYLRQNAVLELSDALRQVKGASTLFQFGTRDAYVSRADTAVLMGATQAPKERKLYDSEHDMAAPQIAADRDAWLIKELIPAPAAAP
jgi:cephalosporin-C deacetylase-like acetyl esterase